MFWMSKNIIFFILSSCSYINSLFIGSVFFSKIFSSVNWSVIIDFYGCYINMLFLFFLNWTSYLCESVKLSNNFYKISFTKVRGCLNSFLDSTHRFVFTVNWKIVKSIMLSNVFFSNVNPMCSCSLNRVG